jgi:DNA-binding LacI/PurR family transcriptional regulator
MLLEAIEIRNQEPMTVRLPVSLIVRGSTGPAPS